MATMLERFRTFATENYEKCLKCGSYPINNDRAIEWVRAQPEGCARDFAELFYANLRRISFDEWMTAVSKMSVEILTKIEKRKYDKVVLVIDGTIGKSNTMVAIIMFHILGNYITDVVKSITRDFSGEYPENTLFIHPDDCSYSGNQIRDAIGSFRSAIGTKMYVIACPYICRTAYELLKSLPVKFPKTTVIFDNFDTLIENSAVGCDDIVNKSMKIFHDREMYNVFQYRSGLAAVYFDHKLADIMSIFQKVLALGPVYKGKAVGSLISGCENYEYKVNGKIADVSVRIPDFDDDGVCPVAFYKTIEYTYNGRVVDKSRIIMSLMEL